MAKRAVSDAAKVNFPNPSGARRRAAIIRKRTVRRRLVTSATPFSKAFLAIRWETTPGGI
jgi:hypothetical protein